MKKTLKNTLAFLVFMTTFSFAVSSDLPIPLQPNIHRTANSDSVFTVDLQSDLPFWQPHNFTFRVRMDATFHESVYKNGRIILFLEDSLANDYMQAIFGGFFDNQGLHGKTFDWSRPGEIHRSDIRFAADLYRALLRFTPNEYITIALGKDYYNWGPSELGGLMLSDYNMGFTGLYQQYQIGPFTIRGIATQLNTTPWKPEVYEAQNRVHRFLSVGRVEYNSDLWGLSLNQSILYNGENRNFEIPYLIPFFPFHYAQVANWRYGNSGSNSMVGADAYVNFLDKNLQIYGEFVVDDFQMDEDETSQSIQNIIGFTAGARFNVPNILYGFFEGGRASSFLYNSMAGYQSKYLNKDAFIGSPLGPDNQHFWGKIGRRFDNIGLRTEAYFWLRRQGERDIFLRYRFADLLGTRHENIPFGEVQRETAGWLSAIYEFKHNTVEIYGGIQNTQTEKISGTSNTSPFFGLSLNTAVGVGWNKRTQD
jgi:hypothetical protein